MDRQDRSRICAAAKDTLAQIPGERKLAAVWAGAAAAAALLTSLVSLLLENQISGTGGLSGMGLRGFLSTAQLALGLFTSIALPFWTLGHGAASLEMSRKQTARLGTLADGFRRFGPALRFFLLQGAVYLAVAILSLNVSSMLFSMTPQAATAMELMMPLMENPADFSDPAAEQAILEAVTAAMLPAILGWGVLFLLLSIPVSYRLRLAQLRLVDEPGCGAVYAALFSVQQMRRNCFSLFLLDLRFWWFYLGEVVVVILCYGDILLPMLGVSLPFSRQTGSFIFYLLSMAAQLGLYVLAKNRVAVTYAKFYDSVTGQDRVPK